MEDLKTRELPKFDKKNLVEIVLCGALLGFVNGFFGGGGGMICVPLLEKLFRLSSKQAHATALLVIFPITFVSAIVYTINKSVEPYSFLSVGSGVLLGGIVGAFLLKFLPEKAIKIIFVFLMFAGGLKMIF